MPQNTDYEACRWTVDELVGGAWIVTHPDLTQEIIFEDANDALAAVECLRKSIGVTV